MTSPHAPDPSPQLPTSPLLRSLLPSRQSTSRVTGADMGDLNDMDDMDDAPLLLEVRRLPGGSGGSGGAGLALVVDGEVDLFTAPKLKQALADTLAAVAKEQEAGAGVHLVLDLRAASYIDSAGIDTVIGLRRSALSAGIPFTVVTLPAGQVQRVLRMTRLDDYLNLRELAADAELTELTELSVSTPPAAV